MSHTNEWTAHKWWNAQCSMQVSSLFLPWWGKCHLIGHKCLEIYWPQKSGQTRAMLDFSITLQKPFILVDMIALWRNHVDLHWGKGSNFWRHVLWSDAFLAILINRIWKKKGERLRTLSQTWSMYGGGSILLRDLFCCRRGWCTLSQSRIQQKTLLIVPTWPPLIPHQRTQAVMSMSMTMTMTYVQYSRRGTTLLGCIRLHWHSREDLSPCLSVCLSLAVTRTKGLPSGWLVLRFGGPTWTLPLMQHSASGCF